MGMIRFAGCDCSAEVPPNLSWAGTKRCPTCRQHVSLRLVWEVFRTIVTQVKISYKSSLWGSSVGPLVWGAWRWHALHFKHCSLMCHQSDAAEFLDAFQWKWNWPRFWPAGRNREQTPFHRPQSEELCCFRKWFPWMSSVLTPDRSQRRWGRHYSSGELAAC